MFEAIQHITSGSGMSIARYSDGEVTGGVAFSSDEKATRVFSHIGPLEASLECVAAHWVGYRGRYKARIEEQVQSYA